MASDDKTWSLIEPFNKSVVAAVFRSTSDFPGWGSPAERGEPPCKSEQLKKDLGLEVSSARHAARLVIFEFMKFFFVGSNRPAPHRAGRHRREVHDEMRPPFD